MTANAKNGVRWMGCQPRLRHRFAFRQNLPRNKQDLNPRDYFHWGLLKELIFSKCPQTLLKLQLLIIDVCNDVTEKMWHRVINTWEFVVKKLNAMMVLYWTCDTQTINTCKMLYAHSQHLNLTVFQLKKVCLAKQNVG